MTTVYSKNNCAKCRVVKMFLDSNGIAYTEINVDENEAELKRLKDMNISSLPYVESAVGNFVGVQMDKLNELKGMQ